MSEFADEAATAQTRSQIYWWLGGCFLAQPSEDSLAALRDSVARLDSGADTPAPVTALLDAVAQTPDLTTLAVEFTRLFRGIGEGSGPPPPFESVYRESRLLGETTVAVLEHYSAAGFGEIEAEAGPQDHISAELRFLALLIHREAEAWQRGDADAALDALAQQSAFHEAHLRRWMPTWCQRVQSATQHPLYHALIAVLDWFAAEDYAQIQDWQEQARRQQEAATPSW